MVKIKLEKKCQLFLDQLKMSVLSDKMTLVFMVLCSSSKKVSNTSKSIR